MVDILIDKKVMTNDFQFLDRRIADDRGLLDAYSKTITGVVHEVADAVLHIQVQKAAANKRSDKQHFEEASGSGFIISSDGFIVTNNHVIEGAASIRANVAMRRKRRVLMGTFLVVLAW